MSKTNPSKDELRREIKTLQANNRVQMYVIAILLTLMIIMLGVIAL